MFFMGGYCCSIGMAPKQSEGLQWPALPGWPMGPGGPGMPGIPCWPIGPVAPILPYPGGPWGPREGRVRKRKSGDPNYKKRKNNRHGK